MAEEEEKEETTRVAMMFPVSVKAQVQEIAGKRGMTSWVLDAVQAKLDGEQNTQTVAPSQDEEDDPKQMSSAEFDETLTRTQSEPLSKPEPEPAEVKPEPKAEKKVEPKAYDAPHSDRFATRGDYLATVMQKAQELGLAPASTLPKPEPKPAPESGPEPEPEPVPEPVVVPAEPAKPVAPPVPDTCQSCGNDLVDGECWWC